MRDGIAGEISPASLSGVLQTITPAALRCIQRIVRRFNQYIAAGIMRKGGDAAAGAGAEISIAVRMPNFRKILAYALHDGKGLCRVGVRQTDEKLLATIAAENIVFTQTLFE